MSRDGSYELLETIISCPTEGVQSERTLFFAQWILIAEQTDSFSLVMEKEMGRQVLMTDGSVGLVLLFAWLLLMKFISSRSGHFESSQGHMINAIMSKTCLCSSRNFCMFSRVIFAQVALGSLRLM